MSLMKRTRFILVQSTSNANVTDDNMEPYHVSVFRRSTSMPPLPRLSLLKRTADKRLEHTPTSSSSAIVPKYKNREKDDGSTNKFYKLNIHAMKKKSARISMRLSNVFGLSSHTVDEEFNFQEQRFRSIEKFSKLFQRNAYTCIETLRENLLIQLNVAEDFQELLADRMSVLSQQLVRTIRLLIENAFVQFCTEIQSNVIQPINTLNKLFILPSNLIAKRNNKLLDYDSAQSTYDKVKIQQLNQAKRVLDLSKQTYEYLNNKLLEELPILYEHTCQILSICLREFLKIYCNLIVQMRTNIELILNQIMPQLNIKDLNWTTIAERFYSKHNLINEKFSQLTIIAKNFSEKTKTLSTKQNQSTINHIYDYDKETYIQTDKTRKIIINRYPEKDLFIVNQDYNCSDYNQLTNLTNDVPIRTGDLVAIVNQNDDENVLVDNGLTQLNLPRSILMPFISDPLPNMNSVVVTPPALPLRQDLIIRPPLPLPRTSKIINYDEPRENINQTETCSTNSIEDIVKTEDERIYWNQINDENHPYASIDIDDSPTDQICIYIALYDFNCTHDGVLCLHVGERLNVLQRYDDDGNEEWWYVEKLNDTKDKGYVPANYIQSI